VNPADPFEGAFSEYGYQWPRPSFDGNAVRMGDSRWTVSDTTFSFSGVPMASPPGVITSTGSVNSAATATAGSNFTVTYTGSNVSFDPSAIAMAGYDQPAPEQLEVRRFYHWNKSATAGTAGRLNGPQKEDVTDSRPIPALIAVDVYETVQATESAAIQVVEDEAVQVGEQARRRGLARRTVLSPRSLTSVAVALAGQKRRTVGEEWRGHLLGEHASGLSQRKQTRAARGFVLAAVRYRLQDATDLAWRPADAVLGSRTLSNLFVWGPVIVMLVAIVRHDGRFGLVADVQDPAALGAFLYGVIRTGRWWRGVKPPEPNARRARE
jgi:hypothetical protein